MVDFPPPLAPTKAVTLPGSILRLSSFITSDSGREGCARWPSRRVSSAAAALSPLHTHITERNALQLDARRAGGVELVSDLQVNLRQLPGRQTRGAQATHRVHQGQHALGGGRGHHQGVEHAVERPPAGVNLRGRSAGHAAGDARQRPTMPQYSWNRSKSPAVSSSGWLMAVQL
jgi:hypothetical protein